MGHEAFHQCILFFMEAFYYTDKMLLKPFKIYILQKASKLSQNVFL